MTSFIFIFVHRLNFSQHSFSRLVGYFPNTNCSQVLSCRKIRLRFFHQSMLCVKQCCSDSMKIKQRVDASIGVIRFVLGDYLSLFRFERARGDVQPTPPDFVLSVGILIRHWSAFLGTHWSIRIHSRWVMAFLLIPSRFVNLGWYICRV